MTNPVQAMRMLITYVVIIPIAILVGYLLTNPMDYGTVGFLAFVLVILISPIFIKWHYPIMVFALACPAVCFFLPGRPPIAQVAVMISLGIAIIERALSSDRQFLSFPVVTWPLLFIAAMAYITAELTGGIGLHTMGGSVGGGKKYITLFTGVATYFALTSRSIPPEKRKLYLLLFMLPGLTGIVSDIFPFLPSPLNYINLLFPPSMGAMQLSEDAEASTTRFGAFSVAIGVVAVYMLPRFGLRGIFDLSKPWRLAIFSASFVLTLLGGFRSNVAGFVLTLILMFFLEGLHRTRLLPALLMAGALGLTIIATCSDSLPYTFQRSLSFLPLKWKSEVLLDAQGSSEWRYRIWRATWPKVPEYLLLGKGYALNREDFDMMGGGTFATAATASFDASDEALAISSDFHSGPLSTLMAFGIWGGIGMAWLMVATTFVTYRNYRYGDEALQTFNTYMFVCSLGAIIAFLFIFGGFHADVGNFAKIAGFSIAMNAGIARRPARQASNPLFKQPKPLPTQTPQPA
jgi:hypothetical protein